MKTVSDDEFELSTGRKMYAHRLMLSIGRTESGFDLGYGADGDIHVKDYCEPSRSLTHAEQREIAQHAVMLWNEFLQTLKDDDDGHGC